MAKLKIYIAGPYSGGDTAENVARAMDAWHQLHAEGYAPYCPHLTHFLHIHHQLPYEDWLEADREWVKVCDAVVRLSGASSGADQECELARSLGIPTFLSIDELCGYQWTNSPRPCGRFLPRDSDNAWCRNCAFSYGAHL